RLRRLADEHDAADVLLALDVVLRRLVLLGGRAAAGGGHRGAAPRVVARAQRARVGGRAAALARREGEDENEGDATHDAAHGKRTRAIPSSALAQTATPSSWTRGKPAL